MLQELTYLDWFNHCLFIGAFKDFVSFPTGSPTNWRSIGPVFLKGVWTRNSCVSLVCLQPFGSWPNSKGSVDPIVKVLLLSCERGTTLMIFGWSPWHDVMFMVETGAKIHEDKYRNGFTPTFWGISVGISSGQVITPNFLSPKPPKLKHGQHSIYDISMYSNDLYIYIYIYIQKLTSHS